MEISQKVLFLGESCGFWIQTGAIVLSVIIAALVLYYGGLSAKNRATIDLIMHENQDDEFQAVKTKVFTEIKAGNSLVNYFKSLNEAEQKEFRLLLNRLEFVALGIRKRVFNGTIYKELQCSTFIKLWDAIVPVVTEIRREAGNRSTLYQEFELLVTEWKKNPVKRKNS